MISMSILNDYQKLEYTTSLEDGKATLSCIISTDEVRKVISKAKCNKAVDIDNLPNEIFIPLYRRL